MQNFVCISMFSRNSQEKSETCKKSRINEKDPLASKDLLYRDVYYRVLLPGNFSASQDFNFTALVGDTPAIENELYLDE